MATLFDLSLRQLMRLQALDPMLDENFEAILTVIFYILDDDSKRTLLTQNLNPKGIFYNPTTQRFTCQKPKTLTEMLNTGLSQELSGAKLIRVVKRMKAFIDQCYPPLLLGNAEQGVESPATVKLNAVDFAEQLESLMFAFDECRYESYNEKVNDVHRAFLYELSEVVNFVDFQIAENRRGINDRIIKLFLKEIYIKYAIQGINFCAWDSDDLDGLDINMPDALKNEIRDRKLAVIETQKFWFLIAPPKNPNANRYSLCRFLEEDREYGLYVTYGCFVPIARVDDEDVMAIIMKLISTIYTLEKALSPSLIKFIEDTKQAHYRHLAPLLRQKILSSGNMEEAVTERLIQYEKKLSSLALARIPLIMQNKMSENDFFIFTYHVEKTLSNIWRDLEAFCLLPVAEFTLSAPIMRNRLMCYRLLLQKKYVHLMQSRLAMGRANGNYA